MAISKDLFSLAGRVAIVTGAGGRPGGIGEAYAAALGVFGASVVTAAPQDRQNFFPGLMG